MTRFFALLSLCLVLAIMPCGSSAQDKTEKKGTGEKEKPKSVTAGNITYVVIKSEVTGDDRQWTLVLEATSNRGSQKILIANARAITAEGKTFDIKAPMGGPTTGKTTRRTPDELVDLPQGVKIQLELKMGALPKDFGEKTVSRLELNGKPTTTRTSRTGTLTTTTIPGQVYDTKAKTMEPLVLKDVPIERLEK